MLQSRSTETLQSQRQPHVPRPFQTPCFVIQTAKSGSFTAAVSKNVATLEQSLNARLFNRTTRSLNLTDEGRLFFAQAQTAFEMLETAAEQIGHAPDHITGTVRVSVSYPIGQHLVMPHLGKPLNRHPDLAV